MEKGFTKKKKTPNRMEKVHFTNAKLTAKCVRNIINLEKNMKIKMATLLREKQEVECELKAQKKEKLRIRSEPRIEYDSKKDKCQSKTVNKRRVVKSALRGPVDTANRQQRHVTFTRATDNDSESDDQSDTDDDQSIDKTMPNLIFSGLTPSRRTQISMAEESSGEEENDDDSVNPLPYNTFRNAFSGRRRSSCKDETLSSNVSSMVLSKSQEKQKTQALSAFGCQSTATSLKTQAFQTEMRMVKPENIPNVQDEPSVRFTRRRSRSAIMSDVLKMRRQSSMCYRPPSAPSTMKNFRQRSESFASDSLRPQSSIAGALSSDWNKQTREKMNDPKKAYRLPSLVADESETRAFFVQLNSLRQEKKKVNENETLLFLRKVDQTRENEELNTKLRQYFTKTSDSFSKCNYIDADDVIGEEEEKIMFERVRGLGSFVQPS